MVYEYKYPPLLNRLINFHQTDLFANGNIEIIAPQ